MNKPALALLIAVGLGGCASPAPLSAPSLPGDMAAPEAWSSGLEGRADLDGWALRIDDPYLVDLIERALVSNSDLSAAQARVDRARALADEARASLWPGFSFRATASEDGDLDLGGEGRRGSLSIIPSWEVDLWGRLDAIREAAALDLNASDADLAAARLSLSAAVAEAYVLAVAARLQTDVAALSIERLSETLGFIEVQADRGLRSGQDLALIRADVETARASLLSSQASERDALRALEVLVGAYPGQVLDTARQLPEAPASPEAGAPADLLRARPDLIALEYRVMGAARRLGAARADQFPRLSFSGDVTAGGDAAAVLFDPANVTWRMLADLSAPVLDGGARRARVRARRAELAEAMAAYQSAALNAFGEVERALDQSQVLAEREAALNIARTEARQALAFVQYRFEVGDGDLLDVLSVQNRVSSLDASVVAIRQQRLDAYLALSLSLAGAPLADAAGEDASAR